MIRLHSMFTFQRTALALAACAALLPAQAQTPAETTISGGAGVFGAKGADRALFNQYSGVHSDSNLAAWLDIDYSLRQDETGTWVDFQGYDLLGDTREMNLVWKKAGEWKLTAEYGGLVRNDLNQVNTGVANLGSTTPVVTALPGGAGTGASVDLQTKRTKLGVGYTKIISPRMQWSVDLKTEKKEGSRLFGIGFNCATALDPTCGGPTLTSVGWATLMLPEPIDANHSQIEARLSYALEKLRFSVGYYGSFYRNANTSLNPSVTGDLYNPVGTLLPATAGLLGYLNQAVALPPDNQAHQLDLSGNYDFTAKTRGTFKLAYSTASQDDVERQTYAHHIASTFPRFTIQNCESCHVSAMYGVPDQSKSMPGVLSGSDAVAGRSIAAIPAAVTGPAVRSCGGCHRAQAINADEAGKLQVLISHWQTNGMYVYVTTTAAALWTVAVEKIMGFFG